MSIFGGMRISASGLSAERLRMDVISSNVAVDGVKVFDVVNFEPLKLESLYQALIVWPVFVNPEVANSVEV